MDNIEKIRKFVKELQQDFISIQPKDCSLELIKSYAGYAYLDKVLSFLDTLSEEPDKEDLNDEIKKFFEEYGYERGGDRLLIAIVARHFAEWQKQQDLAEMAQSKSPLSVAYANRCFENGKQAMKEQILKDAIYYVVQDDLDSHGASYNIPFIRIGTTALKPKGIGVGDKVRIVVLKENEE